MVGYPKAHLWVEAKGADDMDLFVLVQKLDVHGTPLQAFTVPNQGAMMHDVTERGASILRYKGSNGRLRVSMRHLDETLSTDEIPAHTFDRVEKLTPGEVVDVEIDLLPIGLVFYPGQQLRLVISAAQPDRPTDARTAHRRRERVRRSRRVERMIAAEVPRSASSLSGVSFNELKAASSSNVPWTKRIPSLGGPRPPAETECGRAHRLHRVVHDLGEVLVSPVPPRRPMSGLSVAADRDWPSRRWPGPPSCGRGHRPHRRSPPCTRAGDSWQPLIRTCPATGFAIARNQPGLRLGSFVG